MNDTYLDSLQAYAEANAPEAQCPHCGEKYLVMRGEGEYECNECGKSFWVTFLIEYEKYVDCIASKVDPAKDPALQKFNDPHRFTQTMPEEPTLAHVATTLQFCLEQLSLCKDATQDTEFHHVSFLITNAVEKLETAQRLLNHAGYSSVSAPLRLEVKGVAVT